MYRIDPILSSSTISFELHAKLAEELDLENCNFRNFRSQWPWPWPWIRSSSHWSAHVGRYTHIPN